MANEAVDILIIGGGLTGASLLLALQNSPWRCRMVDNRVFDTQNEPILDARSLALAPASMRIFEQLGIANAIYTQACPIHNIHVSQQGRFARTCLQGQNEALGQVIELNSLNRIMLDALDRRNITAPAHFESFNPDESWAKIRVQEDIHTIHYRLLIAADGAQSLVRKALGISAQITDYQQSAIVSNIALKRSHNNLAFERFTSDGPLAMLPLKGQRAAMIWALDPVRAQALMDMPTKNFLVQLQKAFGYRLGRMENAGQRNCMPLYRVLADDIVRKNTVLIGSAAQHLHPVAGQGFNLALRDVAVLAQCLHKYSLQNKALHIYSEMRKADRKAIAQFTDGLVRLFRFPYPGMSFLRSAGLLAFDHLSPLQNVLARYARGFGGSPPDLACGLSLEEKSDAV